jgi:hypothetical protein
VGVVAAAVAGGVWGRAVGPASPVDRHGQVVLAEGDHATAESADGSLAPHPFLELEADEAAQPQDLVADLLAGVFVLRNRVQWPFSCLLGSRPGFLSRQASSGSFTICEKITALAAASGRRAHQRWSVLGCPWRIDFSRAQAALIASSGSATSMSFSGANTGCDSAAFVPVSIQKIALPRPAAGGTIEA